MPRFVICASPLVKCYLQEWHDRLLDNPDHLVDLKSDFDFIVPHGCGGMVVKYNKPMGVAAKARTEQDEESKYKWLIGDLPNSQNETDCFGLVPFEPGIDLVERSDQMAQYEALLSGDPKEAKKAQDSLTKMMKDTAEQVAKARLHVAAQSEARIKRAMKTVHNNLIRQWQINEESKLGKYPPSTSELFGAHVLDAEIRKAGEKGAKVKARMNELMSAISV